MGGEVEPAARPHSSSARPTPRPAQLRQLAEKIEPERSAKRYRRSREEPPKDVGDLGARTPVLHPFLPTEWIFALPPKRERLENRVRDLCGVRAHRVGRHGRGFLGDRIP